MIVILSSDEETQCISVDRTMGSGDGDGDGDGDGGDGGDGGDDGHSNDNDDGDNPETLTASYQGCCFDVVGCELSDNDHHLQKED